MELDLDRLKESIVKTIFLWCSDDYMNSGNSFVDMVDMFLYR